MERLRGCLSGRDNESEAELLRPWRMYGFGGWAKEYKVNPRWIKDGQISSSSKSKDHHSWLRSSQLQGRDVCILGATKNICRVCVEAWNAGFKPVLVLLQDLIDEDVKEDVLRAAYQLQRCHYRSGLLHTAFEVLVVDSHHVRLKLDVDGQPMDINVAAPHFCYPFQGPAIVLGSILRHDMLEDVHERSLEMHHRTSSEESAVVLDPRFWEERRDPECMPYTMMTYKIFVSAAVLNVFQTMAIVGVYRAHEEEYFGVWRVLVDFFYRLTGCHGMGVLCGACILELPTGLSPFSFVMMWIFEFPAIGLMLLKIDDHLVVSDFLCGCVGNWVTACFVFSYAKFVAKARITKWAVLWYVAALSGAIGGWVTSLPILLIYQLLLARNGLVASIYLTVAFTGVEAMFVKFMSFAYANMVSKRRAEDPTCVPGDQKVVVSLAIHGVHAFTETARLASLLSGAIAAEDASFLRNVVIFNISSIALNTAVRTATLSRFTIQVPILGRFLCPTSMWGAHNNSKFTMGWGRFFSVLGVMLGRGLIHGHWEIPMTAPAGVYCTWCWSGTVLITVCLAFLSEVLEDALVFFITRHGFPFPSSRKYEEIMLKRLKDPSTATRQHVCHYAIPQLVDSPSHGLDEEVVNRVGPPPCLTNQRVMSFSMALLCTSGTSILLMTDLSMGIGSGNLMGFCRPLDIQQDSFLLILRNAVLWSTQCDF